MGKPPSRDPFLASLQLVIDGTCPRCAHAMIIHILCRRFRRGWRAVWRSLRLRAHAVGKEDGADETGMIGLDRENPAA